jgi:hypothetical protein
LCKEFLQAASAVFNSSISILGIEINRIQGGNQY